MFDWRFFLAGFIGTIVLIALVWQYARKMIRNSPKRVKLRTPDTDPYTDDYEYEIVQNPHRSHGTY